MTEIKNSILSGHAGTSNTDHAEHQHIVAAQGEVDESPKYFLIFMVALVALALLWSWLLAGFNADPSMAALLPALSITLVFAVIASFLPWFVRGELYATTIMIISGAAMVPFLSLSFSGWLLFGILGFVFFWHTAFSRARHKINEWLEIRFWRTTSSYIKTFMTGFAIFIALLYAGAYAQGQQIPLTVHRVLLQVSAPLISGFIPDFDPDMSVESAIESWARTNLASEQDFQRFSEAEQQAAFAQIVHEGRLGIAELTQTPIRENETVATYSNLLLNQFLQDLQARDLGILLPILIALFLFGIVRIAFFFLRWLVALIAEIIYYLLRSVEVIAIETEPRRKEIIILK